MKIYILYEGNLPYSENAMYVALGFTNTCLDDSSNSKTILSK